MAEVGDVLIGKYRLDRLIGMGGMGSVYVAEHIKLGKRVAIKIPREEIVEDDKAMARFEREPRVVAATGHRGIVEVHDVETTDDGCPFVVMELLEGESLGALLRRESILDVERAIYFVAQVLSALDAAHEQGIIHRDLKPDNVFLVDTGHDLPDVKILDFGTSKFVGGSKADSEPKLTETGTIIGTPFYMAPEQISDDVELDHRLDIYAAGVMLYEALTGRLPFMADSVYTLVKKVLNDEIRPPRDLNKDIPEALEEVVLRALARDRDDRYSSAASMLRALLQFLDKPTQGRIWLPEVLREVNAVAQTKEDIGTAPTTPAEAVVTTPATDTPLGISSLGTSTQRNLIGSSRLLPISLAVGATIIIALFVISIFESGQQERPANRAGTSISGRADASASSPETSEPSKTAQELTPEERLDAAASELVTLTIGNVPDGGVVYLGRSRLPRGPVSFAPSLVAKQLVVKVGVDEVYVQHITLDEDVSLDLAELIALSPDAATKGSRRGEGKRAGIVKNGEKNAVISPLDASNSQPPNQHKAEPKQDLLAPMQWKRGGNQR